MSNFKNYLQNLDRATLGALRTHLAAEMFSLVSQGNRPYTSPTREQKIRDEASEKSRMIALIDEELEQRKKRNVTTSKRKASPTSLSSKKRTKHS